MSYPPLNKRTIYIHVYDNAFYATNDDLSSQLGHLILFFDEKNFAHILDYSRKKARRVVRSIMAGKLCAFMNALDAAYVIAKEVGTFFGFPIDIFVLTDSKQIFDSVIKGKTTSEKRLMIDLCAARKS